MEVYDKKSGSSDSGWDYEFKIASLLALRFALDVKSQDMRLGINLDRVGNFDDVVLFRRELDGTTTAYLMQLKHQGAPKIIKQREFTSKSAPKDFKLRDYYDKYKEIHTKLKQVSHQNDTLIEKHLKEANRIFYVLYTNRSTNTYEFLEKVNRESLKLLNTGDEDSVYGFRNFPEYAGSFLSDLFLFANQSHLDRTEEMMADEIKKVLGEDFLDNRELRGFVERYCAFVRIWGNDKSVCAPLTKSDVLNQMLDSLLNPFKIVVSKDSYSCHSTSTSIWNVLVSQKRVVVVDFAPEIVSFLKAYVGSELKAYRSHAVRSWSDVVENGLELLTSRKVKVINGRSEVTLLDVYRSLWFGKKVPLLLQVETADDYNKVQRLLKTVGAGTRVIIVTKNDATLAVKPELGDYLTCLADLKPELLGSVLRIPVKLQGRGPIPLDHVIDESMYHLVKVHDIVRILSGTFTIGKAFKKLPKFFIERFLPKVLIEVQALEEVPNEFFVVENELGGTPRRNALIVSGRDEALRHLQRLKKQHAVVHWLKYDDERLEWLQSFGGAASLHRYQYTLHDCTKTVDDVCSTVNIVSASPGMGKSVLLDYVAQNAPTTKWVLRLNSYELEDKSLATILESAHGESDLAKQVIEKYKRRKDIVVLLDGIDEVLINKEKHLLMFAKEMIEEGFVVWMTTRQFKEVTLVEIFGTIAVTLVPFTVEYQRSFLMKYFEQIGKRNVLRDFVEKLLEVAQNNMDEWSYEFTETPLHIKLLADVFYADCQRSCASGVVIFNENFDLLYLYEEFIKKKLDIMSQKFGRGAVDVRVLFEHHQKLIALRTVFSEEYTQSLDVDRQLEEFSQNEHYKMQIMQRDGILEVESGVVRFVHRTFAEYLAAQWLAENSNKALMQLRFTGHYKFLFKLFDQIVSRNNALHTAVINLKTTEALELIESNPELARWEDVCGRNVAHIIALYGIDYKWVKSTEAIMDPLLDVLKSISFAKELACLSDKVLSFTPLDYAVTNKSFGIANFLAQYNFTLNIEDYVLFSNLNFIFKICVRYGYSSLIRAFLKYYCTNEILFKRNIAQDELVSQFPGIEPDDHEKFMLLVQDIYETPLIDLFKRRYLNEEAELPDYYYDLHFASAFGTPDNVSYLIDKGADVNLKDSCKNTCLHYACSYGRVENVRVLLEANAKIDFLNMRSFSIPNLFFNVPRLLDDTAKYIHKKNKFIPPHYFSGYYPTGDLIRSPNFFSTCTNLKFKTDKMFSECRNCLGAVNNESPLFFAIKFGHFVVASMLLSEGANVHLRNMYGQSVLNIAAEQGCKELVIELLNRHADVNNTDVNNDSPMHDAILNSHFDIAKLLLEKGAKCNFKNKNGYNPLHFLAGTNTEVDNDLLDKLLKRVDVNTKTFSEDTALHFALVTDKIDMALKLLSHGADVSIANCCGNTPLHIAAFKGNIKIVLEILNKGGDCNLANKYGYTALFYATREKHLTCTNLMLLYSNLKKPDAIS